MAITSLDQYIAAQKQSVTWMKTGAQTLIAAMPYSVFSVAGNPGAGTLAGVNTANGVVPDDTVAGYPALPSFGGLSGYISRIDFSSSVPCRLALYDRLFVAGAYSFNSNVNLVSQPSYLTRIPNANYSGTQLWIECVTAFTGNLSINVTYLNQDGVSKSTGTIATGLAPAIGRMIQLPLAAGDSGVSQIVNVTASVATVGTFNIMVLRPLWTGRVKVANDGDIHDLLKTGMIQIYDTSALYMIESADSTAVGLPYVNIQLAIG